MPLFLEEKESLLTSTILGSGIVLKVRNSITSMGIAESILGGIEAFIATSNEGDVMPRGERFQIYIEESHQLDDTPQISFPDNDSLRAKVLCPKNFERMTLGQTTEVRRMASGDSSDDRVSNFDNSGPQGLD